MNICLEDNFIYKDRLVKVSHEMRTRAEQAYSQT